VILSPDSPNVVRVIENTSNIITVAVAGSGGSGGSSPLPSLTAGSVIFSNGTTIAQDNVNFFWDDTNNRLGIGNNSPSHSLDVTGTTRLQGAVTAPSITGSLQGTSSFAISASWAPSINIYNTNGTLTGNRTVSGSSTLTFNTGGVTISNISTGAPLTITRNNDSNVGVNFVNSGYSTSAAGYIVVRNGGNFLINSTLEDLWLGVGGSSNWNNPSIALKKTTGNVIIGGTTDASFKLDVLGTTRFVGNSLVTGSLTITGSLNVTAGITSSLFGTASWAINATTASFASTASFAVSSSRAVTSSFALTASFVTGSEVYGPIGPNSVISASHAVTASYALNAGGDGGGAAALFNYYNFI
jgi:hypothetical protein